MSYIPNIAQGITDKEADKVVKWATREYDAIAREFVSPQDFTRMKVLYVSPTKLQPGMIVYADGVSWNPGAGEGLYRRTLAGAWVLVG